MNITAANKNWCADMRQGIEQALETGYAARPPTEVVRAARYVTLGGGHRWRGLLAVAAGAIFRNDAKTCVLPLAAALEMMHAASLVLDDLPSMDHAATRRGKACVHLVFPDWVTDLLPAYLVNLAYHVAADNPAVSAEGRVRALTLLGEMGEDLARGQEQDLALTRAGVSEAALLECYALKSGSLFAAPLAGGALLCGAGAAEARLLREAGLRLGQAYQILDDIADGPDEDSEYREAGRCTAYSLWGPAAARRRAQVLLDEAGQKLDGFGAGARWLRAVREEILAQVPG